MGVTTRLFFADPARGWRRFSWNTAYLLYHGADALPAFAGQTIIVAFAHVEVDRHRVIQLIRVDRGQWRFDEAGYFDQAFMREEARIRYWPSNRDEVQQKFTFDQSEINGIRDLLKL